ncbi:GGDEF domain-containing protein [Roseomonas rosulenta]|uniref:GGDEF domain-containing protein n=1 Tax=Roseomonas rosulenta TaxID=2748667 RepID=UPI0018DF0ABE
MTTEAYIHLGLRSVTALLALAAVAFGVLRALTKRGDWFRRLKRLIGALVLLGIAWLALHDVLATIERGTALETSIESWVWVAVDALLPVFFLLLIEGWRRRDALEARLAEQSETDPLTGLPNRRGFSALAGAALAAVRRHGEPCVVVALDLDRFKAINDGHGHAAGDVVLRGVAAAIRASVRGRDVAGRLGGEEFALLLPGDDVADAVSVAERLRALVRATVPHPAGGDAAVTLSAGVAVVGAAPAGIDAALAAADRALYEAKRQGRDRVLVAG